MENEEQEGHVHNYRIFRDNVPIGILTFYCTVCLKLKKIEKKYEE